MVDFDSNLNIQYEEDQLSVFVISENYNLSLFDLYSTNQAEKTTFGEDFLLELSFSVLKALDYLNKQSNKSVFKGYPAGLLG